MIYRAGDCFQDESFYDEERRGVSNRHCYLFMLVGTPLAVIHSCQLQVDGSIAPQPNKLFFHSEILNHRISGVNFTLGRNSVDLKLIRCVVPVVLLLHLRYRIDIRRSVAIYVVRTSCCIAWVKHIARRCLVFVCFPLSSYWKLYSTPLFFRFFVSYIKLPYLGKCCRNPKYIGEAVGRSCIALNTVRM